MPAYELRFIGNSGGEAIVNTMGIESGEADLLALAVAARDAWSVNICPVLSQYYNFEGAEVRGLAEGAAASFSGVTAPRSGQTIAEVLPTWVCVSIALYTADPSRSGRGRVGLSPVGEGESSGANGNVLSPAALAKYTAAFAAFEDDLFAGGAGPSIILSVISRTKNKVVRPTPISQVVTSFKVNSVMGSRLSRHPSR